MEAAEKGAPPPRRHRSGSASGGSGDDRDYESDGNLSDHLAAGQDAIEGTPLLKAAQDGDVAALQRVVIGMTVQDIIATRGSFGETALCVCLLVHSPTHVDCAKFLVDRCGAELVNAAYTGELFQGQTPLHIAIAERMPDMVRFLVDNGADVHARAMGTFFQEGGEFEAGEYPLCFAVATGQDDVAKLLLKKGAFIRARDTEGNTALHVAVAHEQLKLFTLLVEWEQEHDDTSAADLLTLAKRAKGNKEAMPASEAAESIGAAVASTAGALGAKAPEAPLIPSTRTSNTPGPNDTLRTIRNEAGDTPLTLAARLNDPAVFQHVLNHEKEVLWRYDTIIGSAYNCNALDESLRVIVSSGSRELVVLPLVLEALTRKWNMFGRLRFTYHFVETVLYLSAFSFASFSSHELHELGNSGTQELLGGSVYYALIVYAVFYTVRSLTFANMALNRRLSIAPSSVGEPAELKRIFSTRTGRLKLRCSSMLMLSSSSGTWEARLLGRLIFYHFMAFIPSVPLRLLGKVPEADACLSLAAVLGYLHVLHYAAGFPKSGHLTVMVMRMLIGDLTQWLLLYAVLLGAYTQAFMLCFRNSNVAEYADWHSTLQSLVLSSLGAWDSTLLAQAQYPWLANLLFFTFLLLSLILMINLLGA